MKRWPMKSLVLYAMSFLGCLVLTIVFIAPLLWHRTLIDERHYGIIRNGMTLQEVEKILGGPGRWEATGTIELVYSADEDASERERKDALFTHSTVLDMGPGWADRFGVRVWVSDHGMIEVHLDKDRCVRDKQFLVLRRVPEDPIRMIRQWLSW